MIWYFLEEVEKYSHIYAGVLLLKEFIFRKLTKISRRNVDILYQPCIILQAQQTGTHDSLWNTAGTSALYCCPLLLLISKMSSSVLLPSVHFLFGCFPSLFSVLVQIRRISKGCYIKLRTALSTFRSENGWRGNRL